MITAPLSRALSRVLEWPLVGSLVAGIRATLTVDPAGDNNAVLYTAKTAGAAGNNISVVYANPQESAATTVAVVGDAVTVTPGAKQVMAVSGIVAPYDYFNGVYIWNSGVNRYIHSDNVGYRIRDFSGFWGFQQSGPAVLLATTATDFPDQAVAWDAPYDTPNPGAALTITARVSTAAQVIAAVNASAAPVTAANAPGNDGSGSVAAMLAANLTGGSDG